MTRALKTLAVFAVLAVAGCAEATAEVNTAPETVQADPQLVRAAEQVLANAPTPAPDWRVGVIVTEAKWKETSLFGEYDEWSIGVLTADGGMVALSGNWCDGAAKGQPDEQQPNSVRVLPVLLDPGDLITWTGDAKLCQSEVRVLRKAAATIEVGMKKP